MIDFEVFQKLLIQKIENLEFINFLSTLIMVWIKSAGQKNEKSWTLLTL
jgi:hypothetical protein